METEHLPLLKPSDAAAQLGVSVATLKRWEAAGTIANAHRTAGGHRRYSAADIAKISDRIAQTRKAWN